MSKRNAVRLALPLFLGLSLGACAGKDKTEVVNEGVTTSRMEKVASERGAHVVSKVSFNKGQSDLSESARSELSKAITEAQKRGEIDSVTVAVWADQEYPGNNRNLPAAQVRLADNRAEKIEDYLSDELDVSGVTVHNMGKEPGALAKFFNTSDKKLKDELNAKGLAPREGETTLTGSASSAVVFIQLK